MTLSQAVTLLETVESGAHWRAAYVVLSLLPGVRTEETRAITWDEVDLTAGMVAVYRSVRGQGRHQDPQEPPRAETAHPGDPGAPRAPRPPGRRAARGGGVVAGARPGVLPSGRNAAGPLARTEGVPEDHQGRPARPSMDARRPTALVCVHPQRAQCPPEGHQRRTSTSVTETVYRQKIRPALTDNATGVNRTKANATELACPCSGKAIGSPIGSRRLSRKTHLTSRDGGI